MSIGVGGRNLQVDDVAAGPDRSQQRAKVVGQGALTAIGLGTALLALRAISIHAPACPLRTMTGVPCPGCGMTRLADAVAHGRFAQAASADLAGVGLLVILAILGVTYLVSLIMGRGDPPRWMRNALIPAVLVGLLAIHWVTTIITGGLPAS